MDIDTRIAAAIATSTVVVCIAIASVPVGATVLEPDATTAPGSDEDEPDTTPPELDAPYTVTVANDPGQDGAIVIYAVTASDPDPSDEGLTSISGPARRGDPDVTVECVAESGSFFAIGESVVQCTATDPAGNVSRIEIDIVVEDREAPVVEPVDDVTSAAGADLEPVDYPLPSASDNSGSAAVECTPAPGTPFDLGVTPVACTATDPAGNSVDTTFSVTRSRPELPATGSDDLGLGGIAWKLILAGCVLVVVGRSGRGSARIVTKA